MDVPKIFIIGLGKSATTALMMQIKESLSPEPHVFFEPKKLPALAPIGNPVVVKSILSERIIEAPVFDDAFNRIIILIREPRDRFVSAFLYSFRDTYWHNPKRFREAIDILQQKETDPTSLSMSDLLAFRHKKWGDRNSWINLDYIQQQQKSLIDFHQSHPEAFLMTYENFVDGELEPLADFLGFSLKQKFDMPNNHQDKKRSAQYGIWRNWFLPEDKILFEPIFAPFMHHYDYSNEWETHMDPLIDPAVSSEYVSELIRTRRRNRFINKIKKRMKAVLPFYD